jgi:hypothetical protein
MSLVEFEPVALVFSRRWEFMTWTVIVSSFKFLAEARRPPFCLLCQAQMINDDDCGALGGMGGRGNRITRSSATSSAKSGTQNEQYSNRSRPGEKTLLYLFLLYLGLSTYLAHHALLTSPPQQY